MGSLAWREEGRGVFKKSKNFLSTKAQSQDNIHTNLNIILKYGQIFTELMNTIDYTTYVYESYFVLKRDSKQIFKDDVTVCARIFASWARSFEQLDEY